MYRSNEIEAAFFALILLVISLLIIILNQTSSVLGCNNNALDWRANDTSCHTVAPLAKVQTASAKLTQADEIAALDAIRIALDGVPDGAHYIWHRQDRGFEAVIRPTQSFKDNRNRICRHVVIKLNTGSVEETSEGIACREAKGIWTLEG